MRWCRASQTGVRVSVSGSQSAGYSATCARGARCRRRLRAHLPRATPSTLVPLARASVSASPKLAFAPAVLLEPVQAELGVASKSSSARKRLMSWRAVRTLIGVPSASSTAAYLEKTAMPGPMMACDRSTGATGEVVASLWSSRRAPRAARRSVRAGTRGGRRWARRRRAGGRRGRCWRRERW